LEFKTKEELELMPQTEEEYIHHMVSEKLRSDQIYEKARYGIMICQ
jgi:hypothetical protein